MFASDVTVDITALIPGYWQLCKKITEHFGGLSQFSENNKSRPKEGSI